MQKFVLAAIVGVFAAWTVLAQDNPAPAPRPVPEKTGLIDMAQVFKESKKFIALRDDLKEKTRDGDSQAKQMQGIIKELKDDLEKTTEGSPERDKKEKDVLKLTREFEDFRKGKQTELLTMESQIYKDVFLEVTKTVEEYAKANSFTMVIRFSRDSVENAGSPADVIKGMNRQIVYYRVESDMTDAVITRLNDNFKE